MFANNKNKRILFIYIEENRVHQFFAKTGYNPGQINNNYIYGSH